MTQLNRWSGMQQWAVFSGLLALGWILVGCTVAGAEEDRPAQGQEPVAEAVEAPGDQVMPSLVVDRVWAEPGMDYGYATVTMTNDTEQSFDSAVRVRCDAVDPEGAELGSHRAAFFASEHGLMGPGFTGTTKVSVPLKRNVLADMNCIVEWAH